jgi:hypothetical protein
MVAVPAGQAVTVVGSGISAVYVLHMASVGAGAAGGGGGSGYQVQVTGTPRGWVYRVFFGPGPDDYVDFDGFVNGVLLEAKGPNLAKFIDESLEPVRFFKGASPLPARPSRPSQPSTTLKDASYSGD